MAASADHPSAPSPALDVRAARYLPGERALRLRVAPAPGAGALRNTTLLGILPIAVLSYGWASRGHPDPTGEQLRRLQPALEAMLCGWSSDDPAYHAETWGVVWDFASLPQRGYTTGYVADEVDISGQLLQSNDDRTAWTIGPS